MRQNRAKRSAEDLLRHYRGRALSWRALGSLTMRAHGYSEAENSFEKAVLAFRLHFGLRRTIGADSVEIPWLSSFKQRFESLAANHLCVSEEAKGILSSRRFRER